MTLAASAPAKIILFGEHAVVYGKPAIAVPVSSLRATASILARNPGDGLRILAPNINRDIQISNRETTSEDPLAIATQLVLNRLNVPVPDITITIQSQIPPASGLGSGAAVTTAFARGLAQAIDHDIEDVALNEIVYEVEKLHHGTPSGIDNTVIVYEKPVYFVRNHPIETLLIHTPFRLLIADTGKSALTRVAVGDVRKLFEAEPTRIQPILDKIGEIAVQARHIIETGQVNELGALMNENHEYLKYLTVSSPELDTLVNTALEVGACGAKLSGGGRGGNMIALVTAENTVRVRQALLQAGAARVFETIVE